MRPEGFEPPTLNKRFDQRRQARRTREARPAGARAEGPSQSFRARHINEKPRLERGFSLMRREGFEPPTLNKRFDPSAAGASSMRGDRRGSGGKLAYASAVHPSGRANQ